VTEAEWLASQDPQRMLRFLGGRASDRKLRLFAVACCRRIWPLIREQRSRGAVAAAELYADGVWDQSEMHAARLRAMDAVEAEQSVPDDSVAAWKAALAAATAAAAMGLAPAGAAGTAERQARRAAGSAGGSWPSNAEWGLESCRRLRDVFGNPFRSFPRVDPAWLAWRGGTVPKLAQAAYDGRDFDSLPVLADALEDAGCADAELLGHLRGPGPHVRGCWAVDLLLGKE
jgi:hypothetical protein